MPKIHPYSRLEFRRRLKVWLTRNMKLVLGLTVGLVASVALLCALLPLIAPDSRLSWWLLGVIPTALTAGYLHLLYTAFLAHDSEAIWHVRGAWGEDNTRDELRRAKRRKLVWGWIDSLGLQVGDIDHLVVTRKGGLVAVDSKWRSRIDDKAEMARAAQKVRLRAEALTGTAEGLVVTRGEWVQAASAAV